MPFGLQGAPATFQRMVDRLLNGLSNFSDGYIDDVIVFSATWGEHLSHLRQVFERIRQAGLTARAKKCQFGTSTCLYLGHIIGGGRVRPDTAKVIAIREFPTPQSKKDVRSFLGITGYYRKFIPDYSSIAAPLSDLTKKKSPNRVLWSSECDIAFNKLKAALCSPHVLWTPDFEKTFILQMDASERGVGAVLSQLDDEGRDRPVAYFSKKLLPRETKYSTIEKECLAIKLGIQNFHTYLMGRPFLIETDHRGLEWLHRIKDTNARLIRWSLFLQSYEFTVKYRPGKTNSNADGLSRSTSNPCIKQV